MLVTDCDRVYDAMLKDCIKIDITKYPVGKRDWVIDQFLTLACTVVDVFLTGGVEGAELANLYSTHLAPSTAKKLRAARSKLNFKNIQ